MVANLIGNIKYFVFSIIGSNFIVCDLFWHAQFNIDLFIGKYCNWQKLND